MAALKVTTIKFIPLEGNTEFLMRLQVSGDKHSSGAIDFVVTSEVLMRLKKGLEMLQVRHLIPIPENLRPQGRPNLSVVEDEEKQS